MNGWTAKGSNLASDGDELEEELESVEDDEDRDIVF